MTYPLKEASDDQVISLNDLGSNGTKGVEDTLGVGTGANGKGGTHGEPGRLDTYPRESCLEGK